MKNNMLIKIPYLNLFVWVLLFENIDLWLLIKHKPYKFLPRVVNLLWWYAFFDFFASLFYFITYIEWIAKGLIITQQNYVIFNTMGYVYSNNEAFLLFLLKSLYFIWITLLPVMFEILNYTRKLQSNVSLLFHENNKLYVPWICLLLTINDLIHILNELGSNFVFETENLDFPLDYWYLYIDFVLPRLYLDDVFADLNPKNYREKLKILIKHSFLYTNELTRFVVLGPTVYSYGETFEIDAREHDLFKDNFLIESFLNDITSGISYETTKFLIFNPLVNIEELREKLYKSSIYIIYFAIGQHFF